jgi:amidohydrolase
MNEPEPSRAVLDEVVDVRRHLHAHPEVGFEEHETSRLIRDKLAAAGVEIGSCPTETGAIGVLRGGRPGRTVLLRADIDALPIVEESGVAFASGIEGRMHACGHDGHTAILLGVASALAERAEDLPGSYVFLFQPAEEIISGAREMIARGVLQQYPADAAVGLHLGSFLESGSVVTRPGLLWAGCDAFEVTVTGPGGHGGMMGRRGNVVSAQAFFLERLHTIVDGLEADGATCHTTVGQVFTDGFFNIVPRRATLRGTVRTFTPELRAEAMDRLHGLLLETDTEFGVKSEVNVVYETVPLYNEPNVTATVLDAGREVAGERASLLGAPLTVSDDMAEFLTRIPGCYFMVGAKPPDAEEAPAHHSPTFRIDEAALEVGVRVMLKSAVRLANLNGS